MSLYNQPKLCCSNALEQGVLFSLFFLPLDGAAHRLGIARADV